jgi:hypothetical protein
MENDVFEQPPAFKLYNDRSVYVGTLLGGPLVAGYLAAENFKQLGEPEKVKYAWIWSVIASIIIFGGVFLIPVNSKFPKILIPILYSVLAQNLVKHFQGHLIKNHIEKGGRIYSIWRTVLYGLIGLVITFGILFFLILLTDKQIFQ